MLNLLFAFFAWISLLVTVCERPLCHLHTRTHARARTHPPISSLLTQPKSCQICFNLIRFSLFSLSVCGPYYFIASGFVWSSPVACHSYTHSGSSINATAFVVRHVLSPIASRDVCVWSLLYIYPITDGTKCVCVAHLMLDYFSVNGMTCQRQVSHIISPTYAIRNKKFLHVRCSCPSCSLLRSLWVCVCEILFNKLTISFKLMTVSPLICGSFTWRQNSRNTQLCLGDIIDFTIRFA